MWIDYENTHTVSTLEKWCACGSKYGAVKIRPVGAIIKRIARKPKAGWALPRHEFGLDVIAQIGALRYQEHRTVGEIHHWLRDHAVVISERSVSNLLDRYDELVTLRLQDHSRLQKVLAEQERVILALDGLQPTVGHEVLWVLRDCISGEVLLARALLSSTSQDIAALIGEVQAQLPVPITGVISDGQHSIQKAVMQALPDVPHGLCHYHYLREAGREIYAADRHAKKELKKRVRGVRPLERAADKRDDELGALIHGYCQAVRSALTDDGRAPLDAAGLRLQSRLTAISRSLARVSKKGRCPRNYNASRR